MTITLEESVKSLRKSYKKWHKLQVVHTDELYDLLAETMRIVEQVRANGNEAKINKLLKAKKISFTKHATLELKVVKVSLTDDRYRASAYARVLLVAAVDNTTPANLKNWIAAAGGIDKVRRTNAVAKDDSAEFEAGKQEFLAYDVTIANFVYPEMDAHKNDIVVLVEVADLEALYEITVNRIHKIQGISETTTAVVEKMLSI